MTGAEVFLWYLLFQLITCNLRGYIVCKGINIWMWLNWESYTLPLINELKKKNICTHIWMGLCLRLTSVSISLYVMLGFPKLTSTNFSRIMLCIFEKPRVSRRPRTQRTINRIVYANWDQDFTSFDTALKKDWHMHYYRENMERSYSWRFT